MPLSQCSNWQQRSFQHQAHTLSVLQERQIGWLLKEYGNAQYIPMNALLAHLQQEIQVSSPSLPYASICIWLSY